jgi:hypothetical protein
VEDSGLPNLDSNREIEKPPKRPWYVRMMFGIVRLLCGIVAVIAIALSGIFLFFGFVEAMNGTKSYDIPIGMFFTIAAYFLWKPTGVRLYPRRIRPRENSNWVTTSSVSNSLHVANGAPTSQRIFCRLRSWSRGLRGDSNR